MTSIANHLQAYLAQRGISPTAFEIEACIGRGILSQIIKGNRHMSQKTFRKLDPFVQWPVECAVEVEEAAAWQQSQARTAERIKPFSRRQRVAELKAEQPIYASKWTLNRSQIGNDRTQIENT